MTSIKFTIPLVTFFVASAFFQAPVQAGPAEELFRECVEHIRNVVHRCNSENVETARRCVVRIERLLAAGKVKEARRLAAHCIGEIQHTAESSEDALVRACRRCIDRLLHLGAPELARRLKHVCVRAVRSIHSVEEESIDWIKAAF